MLQHKQSWMHCLQSPQSRRPIPYMLLTCPSALRSRLVLFVILCLLLLPSVKGVSCGFIVSQGQHTQLESHFLVTLHTRARHKAFSQAQLRRRVFAVVAYFDEHLRRELCITLRTTVAVQVAHCHRIHRVWMSVFGCGLEPLEGRRRVLRAPDAFSETLTC